jgi:hypothetical protein
MTVTQEGIFRHGTFGFPVEITLSSTPVDLTLATSVALAVKRPKEDAYNISAVPTVIDIPAGKLRWLPVSGDLTGAGVYHLLITVAFGPTMTLTVDGTMKVS